MVRLVTTSPILSAFAAIPPALRKDLELPDTLEAGHPISHDQIIRISRHFQNTDSPGDENAKSNSDGNDNHNPPVDRSLDALLRGTKLYIPPSPPKPEPVCLPSLYLP